MERRIPTLDDFVNEAKKEILELFQQVFKRRTKDLKNQQLLVKNISINTKMVGLILKVHL